MIISYEEKNLAHIKKSDWNISDKIKNIKINSVSDNPWEWKEQDQFARKASFEVRKKKLISSFVLQNL